MIAHLLLMQVFHQEDEELLTTTNTILLVSLGLLSVSIILTVALVFVGSFSMSQETGAPFKRLGDYALYSFFCVALSTLMTVLIKGGSFEHSRARFIWASFLCILVSLVIMATLLISLVL